MSVIDSYQWEVTGISFRDVHGIAEELGVDVQTVRRWIHSGRLRAFKPGKEYRVRESDLEEFLAAREVRPKVEALLEEGQPSFNDALADERRTLWESAVKDARQLRETGRDRLEELLRAWRKSKWRQEDAAERRSYLDEMGELLQQSYDAETTLFRMLGDPPDLNAVDLDEFEELQAASRFYGEMYGMVEGAELYIRKGTSEDAQKGEGVQEGRPAAVEEPEAA